MNYLFTALYDIAVATIFGFLAYHFNLWWIILFSIFFLMKIKSNNKENEEDE